MDEISKVLARLTKKERVRLKGILQRIAEQKLAGLDVRKFQGFEDLYRVRVGSFRINLRRTPAGVFYAISLQRRTSTTYRK